MEFYLRNLTFKWLLWVDGNACAQIWGVQLTEIEIGLSTFPLLGALVSHFQTLPHIHQNDSQYSYAVPWLRKLECSEKTKSQELARLMIWWDWIQGWGRRNIRKEPWPNPFKTSMPKQDIVRLAAGASPAGEEGLSFPNWNVPCVSLGLLTRKTCTPAACTVSVPQRNSAYSSIEILERMSFSRIVFPYHTIVFHKIAPKNQQGLFFFTVWFLLQIYSP